MATTRVVTTAEELALLPDDGWQYELIEGELRRMAAAGGDASNFALRIGSRLIVEGEQRGFGRAFGADGGFFFGRDPDTVMAPDAAFVLTEHLPPARDQRGYMPVVPDLAVEVVSPTDRRRDVDEKVTRYLAAGVRLVWVAWPDERLVVVHALGQPPRELSNGDVLDGGAILPEFRLPVSDIFR